MTLTYGSLFSGIGGIDLGLDRAGFECKWQVEIDPYATKVLAKHWPDVARYGDIRECGEYNLTPVDLIAGGFPCQDISNAGKRIGIEGSRSGLWSEFYRIVCELRPRFVLVENVSALLNRGIDRVLGDLAASGYDAQWQVLPASAFSAPHRRERIFIVAYPTGIDVEKFQMEDTPRWVSSQFGRGSRIVPSTQWKTNQPGMVGMVHGISNWLDRSKGLGNAVVPQVAEYVGRCILHAAEMESAGVA